MGLFIGFLAPDAVPLGIISTIGLVLFFYGIGIQYGRSFVSGLRSATGQRQNAIASTMGAGVITALLIVWLNIPIAVGAGLFTGALVNTAALESVLNKLGHELPAVGYGIAYPFGSFGPILWIYLLPYHCRAGALRAIGLAFPRSSGHLGWNGG